MLEEKKSTKIAKKISSFQKIIVLLYLLSFALLLIYCLGFATPFYDVRSINAPIITSDLSDSLREAIIGQYCVDGAGATCGGIFTNPSRSVINMMEVVKFANEDIQPLNHLLFYLSLGGILVSLLLYVYRAQIRKRYYFTNYIVAGICSVYSLVTCVVLFVMFGKNEANLSNVNFDLINAANKISFNTESNFTLSSFNYIYTIGKIILLIMLLATIALVVLHVMKFIAYKDFDKKYKNEQNAIEGGN